MARRRRPPRPGALSELPPLKILSQIAALQALYYLTALILLLFTSLVAGTHFSLDLIFGWSSVRGDTTQGWIIGLIWILDGGLFMALAIVLLIGRSKLVLDFALSLHAIHLLITTFYTGALPSNTAWWLSMGGASCVAILLATWGCRYRELKPISFGGIGGGTAVPSGSAADAGGAGMEGDEEQGYSRGRGRGRGRDGAGEYEMVKMNGSGSGSGEAHG
ncbi:integral membrane protein S linking to the trans Golgi network-domain-containing protein [Cercophora newfieldiana]|uniref:Integral membrane protein S linking to the trans Golgi network-domain-containing protein n=1 Tax=Cercophora newfieldiana TaxID=92897 RepID=A0AA39YB45_9PEZI|nr:integral membrane protein S linking to the trans Golgi network-domain-containing protein [Cercophora newfieldiana]